jgi:hypothetical protein
MRKKLRTGYNRITKKLRLALKMPALMETGILASKLRYAIWVAQNSIRLPLWS